MDYNKIKISGQPTMEFDNKKITIFFLCMEESIT